jgi:hypothetical protein
MGLGIPPRWKVENIASSENEPHGASNSSPIPPVRRLAKSFSVAPSTSNVHKGIYLAFKFLSCRKRFVIFYELLCCNLFIVRCFA